MKITGLEVDGFGVWSGLKLDPLSEELNVFFGPNEAGKTTLMQFIRSVLYGFTPERSRYVPPVHGGRPGGAVHVVGPNGRFQVSRHPNEEGGEELFLEAPDGTRQGGHLLKVLLANVDEAIFNNVFAVGLDELHALRALDDTEAASLLYSLSAGLDRVALVDVLEGLESSREQLLRADGRPCRITELYAEREKLRAELGQLDERTHRYLRLTAEREQLEREAARLEEDVNQLRYDARVLEIAAVVGDRWAQRAQLDERLRAMGRFDALPEGAVEQLDAVTASLAKGNARMSQLREAWDQLRAEAGELKPNKALCRLGPRIEALGEQTAWIMTLQSRGSELETEITDLEAQLAAEQSRFGLGKQAGGEAIPTLTSHSLRVLRDPARELRRCRQRKEEAEGQAATASEKARSLADRIDAALTARNETDLAEAMDRVGGLVAQLRRRAHLDQRLDRMDRHQAELEEESRDLLQRQVLPGGLLMALGGVFVASVMMILAGAVGLFASTSVIGAFAWPLALLGLAGLGAAVATKLVLERSNARRLDACQEQLGMLKLQITEARQEHEALDEQLSTGDGSVSARLRAAEEELAELEELVPLDAQRKASEQEAEAAATRARQAEGELKAARRRWQQALHALGLPTRLSPKQVRDLTTRSGSIGELRRRLESRYEEYEARRGELEALTERVRLLAAEAGLPASEDGPTEQVRTLTERLSEEETRLKRRESLRGRARQLRRKRAKCQRAIRRLKYRRQEILRQAGAVDEHGFRERAAEAARALELRRQRDTLAREIDAAIAGHCPEEVVAEQLQGDRLQSLEMRYEQIEKRLRACEAKLQEKFEQRGTLGEQLRALADDRQTAAKQLDLAMVDQRLREAVHRWRVLAVTGRILTTIRTRYEQERQPETLQEASVYLERLTEGRYVRVWTPLDEDVLLVDDAQGSSLPLEILSRGGREQLFLALRLALAACFARRGAALPVVLDDVLVNFDSARAKAAVAVLRDFAAAGNQVLVFTCHEHIVKRFKSLRVQVAELPDNRGQSASVAASQKAAKKRRKAKTPPKPAEPKPLPMPAPETPARTPGPVAERAPEPAPEPEPEPIQELATESAAEDDWDVQPAEPAEERADVISVDRDTVEEVKPVVRPDALHPGPAAWHTEGLDPPGEFAAEAPEAAEEAGEIASPEDEEEMEPVVRADTLDYSSSAWPTESLDELLQFVAEEAREAEDVAPEEATVGDDFDTAAYHGFYGDQGSYDDYGVEIANHYAASGNGKPAYTEPTEPPPVHDGEEDEAGNEPEDESEDETEYDVDVDELHVAHENEEEGEDEDEEDSDDPEAYEDDDEVYDEEDEAYDEDEYDEEYGEEEEDYYGEDGLGYDDDDEDDYDDRDGAEAA